MESDEVERRLYIKRLRIRRTGMSLHFMQLVARHGERVARWQVDRGKPYWRRAKRPDGSAPPIPARKRAQNYAAQNLRGVWPQAIAKASARATAAEGLVAFHTPERARAGLLKLGFTHRQIRRLLKHAYGRQGTKPIHTVIDEVRHVSA